MTSDSPAATNFSQLFRCNNASAVESELCSFMDASSVCKTRMCSKTLTLLGEKEYNAFEPNEMGQFFLDLLPSTETLRSMYERKVGGLQERRSSAASTTVASPTSNRSGASVTDLWNIFFAEQRGRIIVLRTELDENERLGYQNTNDMVLAKVFLPFCKRATNHLRNATSNTHVAAAAVPLAWLFSEVRARLHRLHTTFFAIFSDLVELAVLANARMLPHTTMTGGATRLDHRLGLKYHLPNCLQTPIVSLVRDCCRYSLGTSTAPVAKKNLRLSTVRRLVRFFWVWPDLLVEYPHYAARTAEVIDMDQNIATLKCAAKKAEFVRSAVIQEALARRVCRQTAWGAENGADMILGILSSRTLTESRVVQSIVAETLARSNNGPLFHAVLRIPAFLRNVAIMKGVHAFQRRLKLALKKRRRHSVSSKQQEMAVPPACGDRALMPPPPPVKKRKIDCLPR